MAYLNENSTIGVTNGVPNIAFHPQLFENINNEPGNKTDLQRVISDRGFRLPNVTVDKLKSPGRYEITGGESIKQQYDESIDLNKSNTSSIMKNIHIENPLSYLFFSERNISDVKKLIKMTVFKYIGQTIDTSPETFKQELMIVMRSIYLEYGKHSDGLEGKSRQEYDRIIGMTVKEVRRLNEFVVNDVTPRIATQVEQYIQYLKDASTQPIQIDLPVNESNAGQKDYRSVMSVLSGNF
jgi:hypothetical protein